MIDRREKVAGLIEQSCSVTGATVEWGKGGVKIAGTAKPLITKTQGYRFHSRPT